MKLLIHYEGCGPQMHLSALWSQDPEVASAAEFGPHQLPCPVRSMPLTAVPILKHESAMYKRFYLAYLLTKQ